MSIDTAEWNQLCRVMNGYIYSQTIATACDLDLFTWLSQHPGATREEIARGLSLSTYATRVLLLACCATELIERDLQTEGYFNSKLAAQVLVSDSPISMISFVRFNHLVQLRCCLHLTEALRENRNAGLDEFPGTGNTLYPRLAQYPDLEDLFQEAMGAYTRLSPQMMKIPEFAKVKHLLDVGGGNGTNALRLCQQHPELQVTIIDLPSVCAIGRDAIARVGMSDRIQYLEADMFKDPWPEGCDGILMSHLVEIFAPGKILWLYQRSQEILPKDGYLFIWTLMADDLETGGLQAAKSSIYFLAAASGEGMAWSGKKHINLLQQAGFDNVRCDRASEIDRGAIVAKK